MIYITVKQSPMFHQMTLEEFLFDKEARVQCINPNMTNTRTYEVQSVSDVFKKDLCVDSLVEKLKRYNETTEPLRKVPRHELYYSFPIPKKSGGLRQIDAPLPELMTALRNLKTIFEIDFGALYHTSSFAYVHGRSTIDAAKRHQANESKWYAKYDLHNFFGSTTLDFVMLQFAMVFPFSEVIAIEEGKEQLRKALELAFLDGHLPQGTPISPLITNVMMIPIDFKLSKNFRDFDTGNGKQRFVNTRYADDFHISSKYSFDFRIVQQFIIDTLAEFNAPFCLNKEKTHYGSYAGSNWVLGLMINANNDITVGYKNKKKFQAMLSSYIMDRKNGKRWDKGDIQTMDGLRNYYRSVEKETIDGMVEHLSKKFGVDIVAAIKEDLKAA